MRLGKRLAGMAFAKVFTSPLKRASRTCELAGFGGAAAADPNLVEWNYGDYEGLRTAEIHARHRDWELFRDGCPDGESPGEVGARADEVVRRLRGDQWRRADFFERPFFASARCPLAWDRTRCRKIPFTKHRQSERARLRKQPVPASDPILERHPSFGRKIKTEIKI